MKLKNETVEYNLDELASAYSGIINIGKQAKQVWNTIAIDDDSIDSFQCNIIGPSGGPYRLNEGQERTECPKGLMSEKLVPCNGCLGRCVNIRAGRPKYNQRIPATPTLINGESLSEFGNILKSGDVITIGNYLLNVTE